MFKFCHISKLEILHYLSTEYWVWNSRSKENFLKVRITLYYFTVNHRKQSKNFTYRGFYRSTKTTDNLEKSKKYNDTFCLFFRSYEVEIAQVYRILKVT